jgi:hypothetical protein
VSEKFEIPGFPGYEIDKLGNVYSTKKGNLLKFHQDRTGYRRVSVLKKKGNKTRTVLVHRLMALTFLGTPPIPSHQVRHLDGNPTYNRIENLVWGTAKDNANDRIRHGRKTGKPSRFTSQDCQEMRNLMRSGISVKNIAIKFQVSIFWCRQLIGKVDRPAANG